jgi:transcriptional regulator with XRE-family HTH domain
VEHPEPSSALGDVIRERREELEMSQEAVGLAADTDQARISRIEEKGESPRVVLFRRLARALGWTGTELMRRLEDRERHK